MDDSKLIWLMVGVVGTLLTMYYRESLRRAHEQKLIATRIEALVMNLMKTFLEGELRTVFVVGKTWDDELTQALVKGGKKALAKVTDDHRKLMENLKAQIQTGSPWVDKAIDTMRQEFKQMHEDVFDYHTRKFERERDDIIAGRSFVSDEDAAKLSVVAAYYVLELRTSYLEIIDKYLLLAITLRKTEFLGLKESRDLFYPIVKGLIEVSERIASLSQYAQAIRQRKILKLTFQNMIGKF
jgi:hypothetical protein